MASSALLYVSGIVFNDFFDIEIDRKERSFRPLPSNEITKQKALIIATVSLIFLLLLRVLQVCLSQLFYQPR
jgi:4-hydroxybenzoate polyprenyltransferase